MKSTLVVLALAIAATVGVIALSSSSPVHTQTETTQEQEGSFASVKTIQDENFIVITITKEGIAIPEGPIIVDPEGGDDGNGTIIVPGENTTVTEPSGNVTVIEPNGNITEVEGNVTNIDNTTVVVSPSNVTETVGGVVVVDPPACGCPAEPEPVPAGNVTETPEGNVTTDTVGEGSSPTSFLAGLFQPAEQQ